MNIKFLISLGITDEEPEEVLNKLGAKEVEFQDKRVLAETNREFGRVTELDNLLEQLRVEREKVKEEAKTYTPKKKEETENKQQTKEPTEKQKDAYEKILQKKKVEAKADQEAVITSATKDTTQQSNTTISKNPAPKQTDTTANGDTAKQAKTQSSPQNTQSAKVASTISDIGDYSKGIKYYQKQDYANALKCFTNVVEVKTVADQTAEQDRMRALYLLATIYRNGAETYKDVGRSNHYLKRAADLGYNQAQLEYGTVVLSQHLSKSNADLKARNEGWKYIEKAADAGLFDAKKKYVNLAKSSSDADKHIIEKARAYIPAIKDQLDSDEAQKCDNWINKLNTSKKAVKKKASYPKKFIIGEILVLLGMIYLFKGLNYKFFEEVIPQVSKYIPNIPDFLIIKWDKLLGYTEPYMTHQGIFGGWLIVIGNIIRELGVKQVDPEYGEIKYRIFAKMVKVIIIILCVFHFLANLMETKNLFGNGSYMQFLAMFGCLLIGKLIGKIMYKIIK